MDHFTGASQSGWKGCGKVVDYKVNEKHPKLIGLGVEFYGTHCINPTKHQLPKAPQTHYAIINASYYNCKRLGVDVYSR